MTDFYLFYTKVSCCYAKLCIIVKLQYISLLCYVIVYVTVALHYLLCCFFSVMSFGKIMLNVTLMCYCYITFQYHVSPLLLCIC